MIVENQTALLAVTYIGGPTLQLELGGLRILTDPTFDRPGIPYGRLEKRLGPAVRADQIGPIDLVLLSHDQHVDNLDHAGRKLLERAGRILTTPSAARRLGGNAEGIKVRESVTIPRLDGSSLRITATPARHGPPECEPVMGDVTGFIIEWSDQPRSALYISGDTVYYDQIAELAEQHSIGIAVLHIGDAHVADRGPDRLTMNADEAVQAAKALAPHTVIPVHYEGWAHFRETKAQAQKIFLNSTLRCRVLWLDPAIRTVFRP